MGERASIKQRLDKLEHRKPLQSLDDILGKNAAFAMYVFERVCVECPDRAEYPTCPNWDCEILIKGFDDEVATLKADDPDEWSLIEGVQIWRGKQDRAEWLKAGFSLFAYREEDYAMIEAAQRNR